MVKYCEDTAIVIVNWNRRADLLALLQSLDDAGYDGVDTIVVDNASTDESVASVRETYPRVHLVVNSENLGGTGGFNTGLQQVLNSKYDYVWLLDNDAVVAGRALEPLLEAIKTDDRIALVGSKLLHPGDPDLINEAGALMNPRTASPVPQLRNMVDTDLPDLVEVDYVAVCSVLARLSHVRAVGLMDPSYFLMWDDMEWGVRFKHAGLRVVAATRSAVFHPPFTERQLNPGFVYYATRNHLYFIAKNYSGFHRLYLIMLLSGMIALRISRERGHEQRGRLNHAMSLAVGDFWKGRMGRCRHDLAAPAPAVGKHELGEEVGPGDRIVVSTNTGKDLVRRVREGLLDSNLSAVVMFGDQRRRNLYRELGASGIWRSKGPLGYLYLIWKMFTGRYDAVILHVGELPRWAYHLGRKMIVVDGDARIITTERCAPLRVFVDEALGFMWGMGALVLGALGGLYRSVRYDTVGKIDEARSRAGNGTRARESLHSETGD